ncbi:ABC transporter substrate-binding protein [Nocardia africana]|uniref:ABC transporter substrate-binding protein n=1 Tax=Nocardia africana TaxID=134964 RepID=A0ABW6NTP2_9NOCA
MNLHTPLTRRQALNGIGALSLAGLLAACGNNTSAPNSAGQAIELVSINFPPYLTSIDSQVGSAYTARTGTTVKVINTGANNYGAVDTRIKSDLAAGHTDAIAMISMGSISNYIDAKRAVALDSLISTTHFDTSQLYPSLLGFGQSEGHIYAIPYSVSTMIAFYNADAFRKAGLDPDKPPTTFSELRSYAQELVSSKAVKYGATFGNDHSGNVGFQNFLFCNRGSMLSDDGKTPLFNQQPGVEVVQFWAKLFGDGLGQTMTQAEEAAAFGRGDLGIMINSSSNIQTLSSSAKFELRTAQVPIPDGGTLRCPAGGAAFVVLTKDPQAQKAAIDAITELVSPQGITTLVKASGYSPVNKTAATTPEYLGDFLTQHPLYAPGTRQMDSLVRWFSWPGKNSAEITSNLDQQIVLALRGNKPAAAALNDAATRTKDLLTS